MTDEIQNRSCRPVQLKAMTAMFTLRVKVMRWTDQRTKKIQEVLGGMKILKLFAWETPYLAFIHRARTNELKILRSLLVTRAGTMALAMSLPLLGSVLAFVTYSAVGNGRGNPSAVFTALTLFNLLRMPLLMLPVALGTITDASNACKVWILILFFSSSKLYHTPGDFACVMANTPSFSTRFHLEIGESFHGADHRRRRHLRS